MQYSNEQGRQQWDAKAEFWDQLHGEYGNTFHQTLISPAVESLLDLQSGESVLDVSCGNGVLARRLVALGGHVMAVDFSGELIRLARQYAGAEQIDYRVVDATDQSALQALGTFDAITCTMALMDIADIAPLFRAVAQMLNPQGRFVFATAHPAFNSNNPVFVAEKADENGELITTHSLKIKAYLDVPPVQGVGSPNEPNPHTYYHRPLHELLSTAFAAGLVLDGIREPAFPAEYATPKQLRFWVNLQQIPPILAGRMRVA